MKHKVSHKEQLPSLQRAQGQIKGIQGMVEEGKYCIDIVIQLHAVVGALYRISENVFSAHIDSCVKDAFEGGSKPQRQRKIREIIRVIKMLHKLK